MARRSRRSKEDAASLMFWIFLATFSFLLPGAALFGQIRLLGMLLDGKKNRAVRLGNIVLWTLFGIGSLVLIVCYHPYGFEWVFFALLIVSTIALVLVYVLEKLDRFAPSGRALASQKTKSNAGSPLLTSDPFSMDDSNELSLYDALRLPGDPDPAFGGCTVTVDTSHRKTDATPSATLLEPSDDADDAWEGGLSLECDNEDDPDAFSSFFSSLREEEKTDEPTVGLSLLFSNLALGREDAYEDDPDYAWETHCEFCGELLEDCECDHRHESRRDLNFGFCDCEEEDCDDFSGGFESPKPKKRLTSFDNFSSFQ